MKIISEASGGTFLTDIDKSAFADYIKVDYTNTPADVGICLNAAANYIEKITWIPISSKVISFISSTWNENEFALNCSGGNMTEAVCNYFDTNNAFTLLDITGSWLEKTGYNTAILHVVAASYPPLYDREDAISIQITVTPLLTTTPPDLLEVIYLLAAYFYECRVNDKEPVMTVVDKIVGALKQKEF